MKNFYFYDIFYHFFLYVLYINTEIKKCIVNDKMYYIGEKYKKSNLSCRICICNGVDEEECEYYNHCKKFNCVKNYSYEKLCCNKLQCEGILIIYL